MRLSGVQPFTVLDYPNHVACIAFTPGCNFRCGYCHNPEFVLPERLKELKGDFIPDTVFFTFLDGRRGKLDGVVVSGGEPTIHPDLPDFIAAIKERGFLVKLDTNGSHPEMVKDMVGRGLIDYIAMDAKMPVSGYAALVGPRVREDAIDESIAYLKQGHVPYEFRATLLPYLHTPEVLARMRQDLRGADTLYLQTFRPATTLDPAFEAYRSFSEQEMKQIAHMFSGAIRRVEIRS